MHIGDNFLFLLLEALVSAEKQMGCLGGDGNKGYK